MKKRRNTRLAQTHFWDIFRQSNTYDHDLADAGDFFDVGVKILKVVVVVVWWLWWCWFSSSSGGGLRLVLGVVVVVVVITRARTHTCSYTYSVIHALHLRSHSHFWLLNK